MNIFAYDPDPTICALWLDDKRKNKMITETSQLLSTCLRIEARGWLESNRHDVHQIAYASHPCTRWVRKSWTHFSWLVTYMQALNDMWPGVHRGARHLPVFHKAVKEFASGDEPDYFVNCARSKAKGLDFTDHDSVHKAYRAYHCARWDTDTQAPTWKYGRRPRWYGGLVNAGD